MYNIADMSPEAILLGSVALLNRRPAGAIEVRAQVKQVHGNVRGPTLIAIHELFDKVADVVEGYSDKIAEWARSLAAPRIAAPGRVHQCLNTFGRFSATPPPCRLGKDRDPALP
jgi:DNA-binding ferritin-like protein